MATLVSDRDLRRFGLFGSLPAADLTVLDGSLRVRDYARGEMVVRHLDTGSDVYVLFDGQLLANQFSASGREISYRRIVAGNYFGELAAVDGLARSVNIVALTEAKVGMVPGSVFRGLLDTSPALARALLADMATRVRDLSNRLFETSAVTVPFRVDAEIIRLAMAAGVEANRATIALPPTHAELAALVGGQREAVTREIGKLIDAGLVDKRGRSLIVLDVDGVIERVEDGGGELMR